jgi:inner membrane transporter RhtA
LALPKCSFVADHAVVSNPSAAPAAASTADRIPPHAYFVVSAIFHYAGPAFAVLLFARIEPLGVAWLRIATAALVFAIWCRPWRIWRTSDMRTRWLIIGLGLCLAAMNSLFYLAIARLPLATVAAIEFVATIAVAVIGLGSLRNVVALIVAGAGSYLLIGFHWAQDALGLGFAFANAILFAAYIVLGHALSRANGGSSVDRLGAAMIIACIVALPIGLTEARPAFVDPILLGAAIGVGLCSSVIPYICDQLAMARLPRATFALLLSLLPVTAALVGAVVLRQWPSPIEIAGILLVGIGVGLHQAPED